MMKALSLPHLSLVPGTRSRNTSPAGGSTPLPTPPTTLSPAPLDGSADFFTAPVSGDAPAKEGKRSSFFPAALRRSTSFRAAASTPSTPLVPPAALMDAPVPTSLPNSRSSSTSSTHNKPRSGGPRSRSIGPAGPVAAVAATHGHPVTQSASQPAASRKNSGINHHHLHHHHQHHANGTASGTATPVLASVAPTQLEDNFIGRVSLRLSDSVNKVFVTEAGTTLPSTGGLGSKGRCVPSPPRAKEFGDIIYAELHAAVHDTYLLRTLLRSSVLKALALFLTRLSPLVLPPSSPPFVPTCGPVPTAGMGAFSLPFGHSAAATPATAFTGHALPPAVAANLTIIKSALVLKQGLVRARGLNVQPIGETLGPWEAKLDELVGRVMSPLVLGIKERIREITLMAQASSCAPVPAVAAKASKGVAAAPAGALWLRELGTLLAGTATLVARIEDSDTGTERDRWLVAVGTCAVWKGMLALAARPLHKPSIKSSSSSSLVSMVSSAPAASGGGTSGNSPKLEATAAPAKVGGTALFRRNSPPVSPNSSTRALPTDTHPSDEAFMRLLGQLEGLERTVQGFITFLSPSTAPSAVANYEPCDPALGCALCRTGRKFDPESSDDEGAVPVGGLAHSAMREAMQALSAMIVVVRATGSAGGRAMLARAMKVGVEDHQDHGSDGVDTNSGAENKKSQDAAGDSNVTIKPLRPLDLLSFTHEAVVPRPSTPLAGTTSANAAAPSHTATKLCGTLEAALQVLPPLLLLHILASRLPLHLGFQLPHELWGLTWDKYEHELRGFRAAEEWVGEIGWEIAGEVGRVAEAFQGVKGGAGEGLELLTLAVRRVGVEVGDD